ncbi:FAD-dependent oxidoreductase [Psychrobacter sp. HD31]|uniref:FAD-dependent oxidoreductase n=1 Tax=Psychrobacter sp. HD31 TaxID=3112003 RepID=UPI003DA370E4
MITIIGTGIVGLTCADKLLASGHDIKVITASTGVDESLCSWWAGGMLAPYCEMESAETLVGELAPISMAYWQDFCQRHADECDHYSNGTIVISPSRDQNMLKHFAQKTEQWQHVSAKQLQQLEPILSSHQEGLFYETEGHIEPRQVLNALWKRINSSEKAQVLTNTRLSEEEITMLSSEQADGDWLLDCRGYSAKHAINSEQNNTACKADTGQKRDKLRGVRGEMLHLYNPELTLSRPIRLLHPRIPIYLVPRANQQFMLGATMIENGSRERASVRSVMELLSALYAVNPAFSQSEIVEIGVDVRPAYPDNLPQIVEEIPNHGRGHKDRQHKGKRLSVNGMYRHGYLLAPAFAQIVHDYIVDGMDNRLIQRVSC